MNGTDSLTGHPPAWVLDAFAAGDAPGGFEAHVGECVACSRHVATLRAEVAAFRVGANALAFAERVRARSNARRNSVRKAAWLAAPALAAVVAGIWASPSLGPSRAAAPTAVGSSERFKGSVGIAVIRDRGGRQDRLVAPFEVRGGDRVRLEVVMDHEGPVSGGLLSSDGSWTTILAPASLGPGTHYSELAARFDDAPIDAVLIVGTPEAVDRARAARDYNEVIAWTVRSEKGQ